MKKKSSRYRSTVAFCLNQKMFYFIFACSIFSVLPEKSLARETLGNSMVKIYTVRNRPDYDNPWNPEGPRATSGSGCVISGKRILTNAHMVSDRTFIRVRLHGRPEKYQAKVIAVSHEADLALLTVEDESFFEGINQLKIGELPEVQQDVMVYGFPRGGDVLSTTKGVISRIEHQNYVHSALELIAAQLDAAVNAGNSGGPVVVDGRIVGVIMQGLSNSENINYMVPSPIIRHFLQDIEDGKYDGFPEDGIIFQAMENSALKLKYGLDANQSGVLVNSILPGTPSEGKIFPGDVILYADGFDVADDGTVEFRPGERTSVNYCTQRHQLGDQMIFEIIRNRKRHTLSIKLDQAWGDHFLVPTPQYDMMPTYYIYGGLVFMPLTVDYLVTWGRSPNRDAPAELVRYFINNIPKEEGEEVVIISKILSSKVNNGYENFKNRRIIAANEASIKNLKELIKSVENSKDPFVKFECENGASIVLDRKKVNDSNAEILKIYRIPSDRSENLMRD